jgi:hypothetical protein
MSRAQQTNDSLVITCGTEVVVRPGNIRFQRDATNFNTSVGASEHDTMYRNASSSKRSISPEPFS